GYKVHNFWDEGAIFPRGRPGAFWWEGPDGSRILVYYQGGYGVWTPGSYEEVMEELPGMLEELEGRGYPFDAVRFAYNGGDNHSPDGRCSIIAREWNERWAYPKLIVGTNSMFFRHIEGCGAELPVVRGELPDTDYVVGAISSARETGINRITHSALPAAEALAAVGWALGDRYPEGELKRAWEDLILFDEHTWGMAWPAGRRQDWNWSDKSKHAYRAAALAESILIRSAERIARRIKAEGEHIVVFNPLSFRRTDVVRLEGVGIEGPFRIVDPETGRTLPHQISHIDRPQLPRPYAADRYALGQVYRRGLRDLLFVAPDLPPMGYKAFRIVRGRSSEPEGSLRAEGNLIENEFYRVEVDPSTGAVTSIFDKELGRELVDGEGRWGVNRLIVRETRTGRIETLEEVELEEGERGPVRASLIVKGRCRGCPQVVQEIALYEGIKRVELCNLILKDSTPFLELFFAFQFGVESPAFRFEGSCSVIEPIRDQLPGSNTDYYAVQRWADVSNGEIGVAFSPLEPHLVELGDLYPGYVSQAHHGVPWIDYGHEFLREMPGKAHIYSFALVSNFRTNFRPSQHGELLFRYSISSHEGGDLRRARELGQAFHSPPIPVPIEDADGDLPPAGSFLEIEPPDLLLLTLKRAEDGRGLILRLMEAEGREVRAVVRMPLFEVSGAFKTNLAEEDLEPIPVRDGEIAFEVGPFEIVTIRALIAGRSLSSPRRSGACPKG
ncbi:hypothetical protein DRP77_10000, partial [Candidatus Poribacteria bacterium]